MRKKKVGFVFQRFNLLTSLTAEGNIQIARHISGVQNGYAPDEFSEILRLLGIKDRMHHRPAELSGGEQQRVAIARALVNRPAILLADEPTGNLDRATAARIADLLLELQAQEQMMLIVVTHSQRLARRMARQLELDEGKLKEMMNDE